MLLLDLGNLLKQESDVIEALLTGINGHLSIHVSPLIVLALGSVVQVLHGVANAAQQLEPDLGMLLLVVGGLLKDLGDLDIAVLLGLGSKIAVLVAGLGHQVANLLVGHLGTSCLANILHHAVLDGDDGLDVQHGAHHGGGCADAAAFAQVLQGVDAAIQADAALHLVQALGDGGGIHAVGGQTDAVEQQQALADGGGHGVHHIHLALKILGGDAGGLVGAGEPGGQGDDHGGVAVAGGLLHGLCPGGGGHLAGGGVLLLAGGQHFIEFLVAQIHGIGEFLLAEADGQGHMDGAELLTLVGQHVGCGIDDKLDSHCSRLLSEIRYCVSAPHRCGCGGFRRWRRGTCRSPHAPRRSGRRRRY